jgi:hypothetical protein
MQYAESNTPEQHRRQLQRDLFRHPVLIDEAWRWWCVLGCDASGVMRRDEYLQLFLVRCPRACLRLRLTRIEPCLGFRVFLTSRIQEASESLLGSVVWAPRVRRAANDLSTGWRSWRETLPRRSKLTER